MTVSEGSAPVLEGYTHVYSGKVRDLYEPVAPTGDTPQASQTGGERMLVVASDRVSAFDHVLSPGITGKGELLTTLSLWWFDQFDDIPNHLAADHRLQADGGARSVIPAAVAGRSMLVKKLDMFPIEAVVRGYITGSGFKEYQASQSICGIALPAGLRNGDRLPEPIYTPAFKAELGEHDENITFDRSVELVGEADATAIRDRALELYHRASAIAEQRGLILADTKFEFGRDPLTGDIVIADEVLTSDSSRYWDAEVYNSPESGDARLASFDKQIVRDWLSENWDGQGTPPPLAPHIIERTAARYRELLERLTA